MVTRMFDVRTMSKQGIGSIQARIGEIEQRIAAITTILDKINTVEFKWLVNEYLPAERRRIESERGTIPPGDVEKQCMAQGQLNEIDSIQNELPALELVADRLNQDLSQAREAEALWYKRNGKRKE